MANQKTVNIAKIMTPKIATAFLHSDDTVRQALESMKAHGYTAIPVLDKKDQYLGAITEGDLLRHVMSVGTTDMLAQEEYKIEGIFRKDFYPPLDISASYERITEAAMRQNFIPIVDDRGCLCGIVTRRAVIETLCKEK